MNNNCLSIPQQNQKVQEGQQVGKPYQTNKLTNKHNRRLLPSFTATSWIIANYVSLYNHGLAAHDVSRLHDVRFKKLNLNIHLVF